MKTLEQLEQQIEELEAEIEDQKELIKKFEDDQNDSGFNHSKNIRNCKIDIHNLMTQIRELEHQLNPLVKTKVIYEK